jgi:hypothetical protein
MLSGDLAVLQAPMLNSQAINPFALFDYGFGPAEVGVCWRHVVETLVVAPVVVMLDEGADLGLKVAGQEVVFQEDPVLQGVRYHFVVMLLTEEGRPTPELGGLHRSK